METLPEAKISNSGRPGANLAGGHVVPRSSDEQPEQPASDLRPAAESAETTGDPAPLREPTIPNNLPPATDAAAAGIILRSSNEDPDQVASDLRLAEDYARATGGPVPPLALVKQYRDSFQQTLQEAKNAKILSESPFLAEWMLTPENAALAGDDLQSLGWFAWLPTLIFGQADATEPGDSVVSVTAAKEDSQSPPEKTLQEMLVEGVVGLPVQAYEAAKGFPGGILTGFGRQMEGTSALAAPLIVRDPIARKALVKAIAEAKSSTPKQIGMLYDQIDQQTDLEPYYARTYLSDVLHGAMTPEQVYEIWEPKETPLPQKALSYLRSGGIQLGDFGTRFLPAEHGMENSLGRRLGTAAGSNMALLPAARLGIAPGIAAAVAQNSGAAASAARQAGQDQHTQTVAAYEGILPGLVGSIPVGRVIPAPAAKAGAMKILKYLGLQTLISGSQNAGQQVVQNAIAQSLYDHEKKLMDDVAVNFSAGALVTAIDLAIGMMAKGAKVPNGPGSRPLDGGAGKAQVTVGEISKNAQDSNLLRRDPETFRGYVDQALRNSPAENIYVPVDQFVDYFTKRGLDPHAEVERLGWTSRSDLDAAIAAGGDVKIPTSTYAAKIAGSEHDAFFMENAKLYPDDRSAKQAAELKRREEEAQKNADDAGIDDKARRVVEGAEKDPEAAPVAVKSQRFMKKEARDGEATDVDEQARRAIEGVDRNAEAVRINRRKRRGTNKASEDAKSVDLDKQAARAVAGTDKRAEATPVIRKKRRGTSKAPGDTEPVGPDKQAPRADRRDKEAEAAPVTRKNRRSSGKVSVDAKSVGPDKPARRAAKGAGKKAEAAPVARRKRRNSKKAL